jgi:hypothetical protein
MSSYKILHIFVHLHLTIGGLWRTLSVLLDGSSTDGLLGGRSSVEEEVIL